MQPIDQSWPARTSVSIPSAITMISNRRAILISPSTMTMLGSSGQRSEEHTSELQSLMRISYAVICVNKNTSHQQSNISRSFLLHYSLKHLASLTHNLHML